MTMSENNGSSGFHLCSRKRKRNFFQPDIIFPTTAFDQPSQLPVHGLDPTYCRGRSESLKGLSASCPWFPRKRRVPQQFYCCPQQTQPVSDLFSRSLPAHVTQADSSTPQICLPTISKSPPIPQKTTFTSPNSCQQSPCTPASLLRPCHICYRRPTTRELIEAYTDCSICSQRSCYICLRQCEAVNCTGSGYLFGESHLLEDNAGEKLCFRQPRKICSRCAVENVTETGIEVVKCLDCVRGLFSDTESAGLT